MIDIADRLRRMLGTCESPATKKVIEAALSEIEMQRSEIERLVAKIRQIDGIIRVSPVRRQKLTQEAAE